MSEELYKRGLAKLKKLASGKSWQGDFDIYESRLLANLGDERRYGTTEQTRALHTRIMDQLNQLAREQVGESFNDLCGLNTPSPESSSPQSPFRDTAFPTQEPWKTGAEVTIRDVRYSVQESVEILWSRDRSVLQQRTKAQQLEDGNMVWLKQIRIFRPGSSYAQIWKEVLEKEGRLLDELEREQRNFPRKLSLASTEYETTLIYIAFKGRSLAETFGNGDKPLDAHQMRSFLRGMSFLCEMLESLHVNRKKFSHRMLTLDTILFMNGQRAVLQDVGLAATPPVPGEGPALYQAPEQIRLLPGISKPGPATDVYQVGAILYHLLTGHVPGLFFQSKQIVVPSEWNNAISSQLDELILKALHQQPGERGRIGELSRKLRNVLR